MEQLADGVFRLRGFPPDAINIYVIDDVLLDAGTVFSRRRILGETAGWGIAAHALTHAHPDHFGSSHAVCEALGIPLWCPAGDVATVERGEGAPSAAPLGRLAARTPLPPLHPVDRALKEGDEVAGFRVLETPGHSPGHCSYWRSADRVLIVGDVLFGTSLLGRPGSPRAAARPLHRARPEPRVGAPAARWSRGSRCSGTARRCATPAGCGRSWRR